MCGSGKRRLADGGTRAVEAIGKLRLAPFAAATRLPGYFHRNSYDADFGNSNLLLLHAGVLRKFAVSVLCRSRRASRTPRASKP